MTGENQAASSKTTGIVRMGLVGFGAVALFTLGACQKTTSKPLGDGILSSPGRGIINGQAVTSGQVLARQVVALVRNGSEGQALCTATLISDSLALTAAHCLDDQPDQLALVFSTELQNVASGHVRAIDRFIQNPDWKGSSGSLSSTKGRSDLGLVHFSQGPPDGFSAMDLDTESETNPGAELWAVGYGIDDPQNKSGEGILRKARIQVVQDINDQEVLLNGQEGGVCFGDSGGPAVLSGRLFAVASAVTSDLCDANSVHTKVAPFADWIQAAGQKLDRR